jgi:hypothetical protein
VRLSSCESGFRQAACDERDNGRRSPSVFAAGSPIDRRSRNLTVNLVEHALPGIACCTILSMDSGMIQAHLDSLERPLFTVRVHANSHASTSSQCGQKQFVRIRSPVVTRIRGLIRLEAVLPNSYGLKEVRALRIYDDSSGHTSPTVRQGGARSSTHRPLVMRPKSFTQDSFEYFAGAALG